MMAYFTGLGLIFLIPVVFLCFFVLWGIICAIEEAIEPIERDSEDWHWWGKPALATFAIVLLAIWINFLT